MIERERLKELIEQRATIYQVYADATIIKMKLDKDFKVNNAHLCKKLKGVVKSCGYPLYKLFETEEEAEWHKEFGCIERTERLELPTWEESKKDDIICLFDNVEFNYFIHDNTYGLYEGSLKLLDLEATKENYLKACRKCKELFLGE